MAPFIWLATGILWMAAIFWLRRRFTHKTGSAASQLDRDLLAGGLLFLATVGFFWRTISGDVFQPADGGDLVSFLFPTYRFAADQLVQGSLPLWNPTLYGGAPFISDIQAGFLYLPNLLLFLTNPYFSYETMQWWVIGHLYWAGLGVYVLLRTLQLTGKPVSRPAALFGALAFQFSDPLLIHVGNLNLIAVLSWLPWVLACYTHGLTTRRFGWIALAGVLFALGNYAGHAQSTVYIGLALVIYTVFWMIQVSIAARETTPAEGTQTGVRHPPITSTVERKYHDRNLTALPLVDTVAGFLPGFTSAFWSLLIAGAIAALLSAPILLPTLELAAFTERSDFTYQDTIAFSLAPTQAIGLITPGFFGRGPALHWSLWDRVETPYAGVATLLLAIGAFLLGSPSTRRRLWPWAGLAIFGFVIALGVYAIVHGWLTLLLPGFDQFRAPARALILWTLGISVLGAAGLDLISTQDQHATASFSAYNAFLRSGALILLGIVLPIVYLSLLLTQESDLLFLRASVAALALTLATFFWLITWGLIAGYRAGWWSSRIFTAVMLGLLFFDLTATGAYTDISSTDPTTGFHHPEIVEFLYNDPDLFRIDTRTGIDRLWQPDAAALHGLQDVGGIANPLLLQHWQQFWESTGGRESRLYDMLNVKYVLVQDDVPLPAEKFVLALDAPGELSVYQNADFLARAWIVHEAQAVADQQSALRAIQQPDFDPLQRVILQSDEPLPVDSASAAGVGGENQSVQMGERASSAMTFVTESDAPGYLVLSEVWYPGWQATVNGAAAEVFMANGALRAVAIPAGRAEIQLRFMPRPWVIGLWAALLGILVVVGILWWDRSRNVHE